MGIKKINKTLVYATKRTYLDGKTWWKVQIVNDKSSNIFGRFSKMKDAFWEGLRACNVTDFSKVNWHHNCAVVVNDEVVMTSKNTDKVVNLYKSI